MKLGKCCQSTKVSKIKVHEGKRSAIIKNPRNLKFERVKVDKCLAIDGPKVDFVIQRGSKAVIIELKGKGVEYGAKQVDATCDLWRKTQKKQSLCGLIVGVMSPRARPTMLVKKDRFARKFGGPLHIVAKNSEYEFEHLFSFKGPFKD